MRRQTGEGKNRQTDKQTNKRRQTGEIDNISTQLGNFRRALWVFAIHGYSNGRECPKGENGPIDQEV